MRNRGIELFMLPDPYQLTPSPHCNPHQTLPLPSAASSADSATVADASSLLACELESVMSADGVPGRQPAACLAAAHLQLVEQAAKLHRYQFPHSLLSQRKQTRCFQCFCAVFRCLGLDWALQEIDATSLLLSLFGKICVLRLSRSGIQR